MSRETVPPHPLCRHDGVFFARMRSIQYGEGGKEGVLTVLIYGIRTTRWIYFNQILTGIPNQDLDA